MQPMTNEEARVVTAVVRAKNVNDENFDRELAQPRAARRSLIDPQRARKSFSRRNFRLLKFSRPCERVYVCPCKVMSMQEDDRSDAADEDSKAAETSPGAGAHGKPPCRCRLFSSSPLTPFRVTGDADGGIVAGRDVFKVQQQNKIGRGVCTSSRFDSKTN